MIYGVEEPTRRSPAARGHPRRPGRRAGGGARKLDGLKDLERHFAGDPPAREGGRRPVTGGGRAALPRRAGRHRGHQVARPVQLPRGHDRRGRGRRRGDGADVPQGQLRAAGAGADRRADGRGPGAGPTRRGPPDDAARGRRGRRAPGRRPGAGAHAAQASTAFVGGPVRHSPRQPFEPCIERKGAIHACIRRTLRRKFRWVLPEVASNGRSRSTPTYGTRPNVAVGVFDAIREQPVAPTRGLRDGAFL